MRWRSCTKMPQEVKSTKSHSFSPAIAENVFSFLDEKEKANYYEIFGSNGLESLTCEKLEGKTLRGFVYFLLSLRKETLTKWVEAMTSQLIVKICEESLHSVLTDFVQGLGSSLMNKVLRALYENKAYDKMSEDKLHQLLFTLQAFEYLDKTICPLDDALVRVGNYLVNKHANDNINKSSTSKAPICTNSSATPPSGVLPYSWMDSGGESCDMYPTHLNQKVVCPVPWMKSEGKSCHNYLQSQQQLHAAVNLKYKVVSCVTYAEMHISIDNVRCQVRSYPSCGGDSARSYYVSGIKIKVEPQPSDSFLDRTPELKLQKSTCDDPRTLQSGREVTAQVDLAKVSAGIAAKATQSTTKNEVQWTYRQFDDGNNSGGMEWTYNSSSIGGDFVFSDDKYPESLIWRIKQDITKPKTLCWGIRTHFYLKSSHNRNHKIYHEVPQRFNFTIRASHCKDHNKDSKQILEADKLGVNPELKPEPELKPNGGG